jgi:hypothetical protein
MRSAERALGGLGPRPEGDPEGLRHLASLVGTQADAAATAGRLEGGVAGSMDFEGPGSKRFAGNASDVAESLFVAQRILDAAAADLMHEARKIETAQHEHDRSSRDLRGQMDDLTRQINRAASR